CVAWLSARPYCAPCKYEHVHDLLSGIVPGALDLASRGRRFAGIWLDSLFTSLAAYALVIPLMIGVGGLSAMGRNRPEDPTWLILLMYPILLGVPLLYEGLMLQRRGQTVGKMALGVRVVTAEGGPISGKQAWMRTVLRLVLGTCMGIDYLPAFFTHERTCLHDMIAKTRVVRVR
ncbi:MAG TPA: RDD family protein, partial [Vicinamibacteria bacterium]|nr:RDD family protein [Vicinamibacteria bacterium]